MGNKLGVTNTGSPLLDRPKRSNPSRTKKTTLSGQKTKNTGGQTTRQAGGPGTRKREAMHWRNNQAMLDADGCEGAIEPVNEWEKGKSTNEQRPGGFL